MTPGSIYQAKNKTTNKLYIGQTQDTKIKDTKQINLHKIFNRKNKVVIELFFYNSQHLWFEIYKKASFF